MHKRLLRTSLIALSCLTIAGCSSMMTREADRTAGMSAPQLYQEARDNVRSNDFKTARTYLEAVEARYPYSSFAQQSLIDQAYVNWKDNEPEKAVTVIDRFLRLYPSHPGTDYMLYLKGLVTFTPPSSYLRSLTGQDPSERDPKGLRQSYDAFNELIERFPESRYSRDAQQRITWLVSTIADNEVNVAKYYYTRHAYIAAINRSQAVLKDFSGVSAAEPALYIMMKSYQQLGMTDQANDAKRILDQNYPNSKYYERGLDGDSGWISWLNPSRMFN